MKIKRKILILSILVLFITIQPNNSKAALQSNGGTSVKKDRNQWILQIRQMQELGGTLGRTDTINTTNLMSNATDLDIHMEKNTEYGAMAILSASSYGNPNKIQNGDTTTGNSTGIVIDGSVGEHVAIYTSDLGLAKRYVNLYGVSYVAKAGDAVSETAGWHGSSSNWIDANTDGRCVWLS